MESLGTDKKKEALSSWVLPFSVPTQVFSLKYFCCICIFSTTHGFVLDPIHMFFTQAEERARKMNF